MNRPPAIPLALRAMQARASDPSASAWVSANAGSGKTHVLTQRVLRLLLAGTPPAQILGLTFTKAAAANMAARIFHRLASWTSLGDEDLARAIVDIGAPVPGPPELEFARRLFARTIETPGGLKIQTLHAFCERLLRLFPFEANVAAHFKVIDEREAAALMEEARDRALAGMTAAPESADALAIVAREAGAFGFDRLLQRGARSRGDFRGVRRRQRLCGGATDPARTRGRRHGDHRRSRDGRRRGGARAAARMGQSARRRQRQRPGVCREAAGG